MPRKHTGRDVLNPAKVFICYKRSAHPDHELATKLFEAIRANGHEPFIDKIMAVSVAWEAELEKRIKDADFFIVLLSPTALNSTIIKTEIAIAQEASDDCGTPRVIQIRINFDGKLPLLLRFLDWSQYASWNSQHDTPRVIEEVLSVINTTVRPDREPLASDAGSQPKPSRPRRAATQSRPDGPRSTERAEAPPRRRVEEQVNQRLSASIASEAAQDVRTVLTSYAPGTEPLEEGAFLTLYLEALHRQFIAVAYDGNLLDEAGDEALSRIQTQAHHQRDYLNRLRTEPELESLFNELQEVVGVYRNRSKDIEEIERQAATALAESRQAFEKGNQDAARLDSKWQAFTAGFANSQNFARTNDEIETRTAARKAEAHRTFLARYSSMWARARSMAVELCVRRHWPQVARSFEGSPEQVYETLAWRNTDPDKYLETMRRLVVQRPMNPFLLSQYCTDSQNAASAAYQTLAPLFAESARSVLLVPNSPIYDELRGEMLFNAAYFIGNAVSLEQAGRLSGSISVLAAERALPILETLENHFPLIPDPAELIVQTHLSLLGAANKLKQAFDYGIRHRERLWKVPNGCYNLACYASLLGQHQVSWQYLEHAFRDLGFDGVKHAATDPDLESLRRVKAQEWAAFFSVKVRACIEHGFFLDDITLTNQGCFAFTNVRLTGYTHQVGGKCNTVELTVPRIDPGETQKWSDVVSVPGIKLSTSVLRCYLRCDQVECWINPAAKAAGE